MTPDRRNPAGGAIEDVWRRESPHVLAALLRRHGDLADCEDAAQEALEAAAAQWPSDGVPDYPRGWLIRVASRRLIDRLRADQARVHREQTVAAAEPADAPAPPDVDDSLQLLLLCCHPVLTRSSQVALTLRAVSGLGTAEIAAAFLVPEATMGQRLSRARATLRDSGARFELPDLADLPTRVAAVLDVLHLVFNEGYARTTGQSLVDSALTREAVRLTRQLYAALPDHDEVAGALALMLLTQARESARTDERGDLVLLADQDRSAMGPGLDRRGRRDPGGGATARPRRAVPAAGGHRCRARGGADLGRYRLAAAQPAVPDAVRPRAEPGRDPEPRGSGRDGPRTRARTGDRAGPAGRRRRR